MSQLQSYDDNIIDISDSDNEQAVAGPLQVQTVSGACFQRARQSNASKVLIYILLASFCGWE